MGNYPVITMDYSYLHLQVIFHNLIHNTNSCVYAHEFVFNLVLMFMNFEMSNHAPKLEISIKHAQTFSFLLKHSLYCIS